MSKRFRTNDRMLRYRRLRVDMFTDTMFADARSKRGNKCAQVYCTNFGWTRVYPMKSKSQAHETFSTLCSTVGVPSCLIMDGAREQTMGQFRKKAKEVDCHIKPLEPYTPWANAAESAIRELKRAAGRKMVSTKTPKCLWDDCLENEAIIRSLTAHGTYALKDEVPETLVTGETPDISLISEFQWYQWIKWYDQNAPFPQDKYVLGRYCGPSFEISSAMCAKILKQNGQYVHRSTFRPLTPEEWQSEDEKKARQQFDQEIQERLGKPSNAKDFDQSLDLDTPTLEPYDDDDNGGLAPLPDRDESTPDAYDQYIGAEVLLDYQGKQLTGRVKGRKRDAEGNPKGTASSNPILDSRVYTVEFPDGSEAEYAANIIAQNMYAQCDIDGNQYLLLSSIVGHKKDQTAVEKSDQWTIVNGKKCQRKTTKGWRLCVEWRDGSTTWERLTDLKESNPVEVAEYAVAQGIDDEPAFSWWVPFTLKRRERIIKAVIKRYHKRTHKFGIEIPKTIAEAIAIDKKNGNRYWQEAIEKEMAAVGVAFEFMDDDAQIPPGYQQITCHMIFDVKMEDFKRKARFVAGGHMTDTPSTLTYASVVSRESVRIALTIAALNDLEVKSADIQNAYITAPNKEKIWTICGPEFGQNQGKRAFIVRALYGLKSAGAAFRAHLADCMHTLGFKPCLADPDVWMKLSTRPEDNFQYYTYVLLYVDDVLVVSHDGMKVLKQLDYFFKMKKDSMGDPDLYLGAKLRNVRLPNGVDSWSLSPSKYVQEAVRRVQEFLKTKKNGMKLAKSATSPFAREYYPELDLSKELDRDDASFYHSQIGVLRWMVELGRIDIITETSMLASHIALPREGHLDALLHIFAYLKNKHNSTMVFDPTYPTIDMTEFKECDWKGFYGEVSEPVPSNAPKPLGKEVDLVAYVDSDHAGDKLMRRSRTGFLIYMNSSPIDWVSKKQPTVETSVFGAEFVAMKHCNERLRALRYKLRMMGIPISGPSFIYGDNMSVIHNTQTPESTLKKKSHSICYHALRESVAMGECLTAHVPTKLNPADLCTKVIPGGQKRDSLIDLMLYDIEDHHRVAASHA